MNKTCVIDDDAFTNKTENIQTIIIVCNMQYLVETFEMC